MSSPLSRFLDAPDSAARVFQHGQLLLKLSRRFAAIAPMGLGNHAHVANYKAGMVVIHADNGAVASKLRQMGIRICAELSKGGPQCTALEVKVQPLQPLFERPAPRVRPLSGKTCRALSDTAGQMPQGPLRAALEQLLQRSAKKD